MQRVQVAFTDHLQREHRRQLDLPAGVDIDTGIAIRQTHVEQGLKDQDVQLAVSRIERGKSFNLDYATVEELKAILQEVEADKQAEIDQLILEKTHISAEAK